MAAQSKGDPKRKGGKKEKHVSALALLPK